MEKTIYSNENGEFAAVYLSWEEVLLVLGHIHTGSQQEDEALADYCLEKGAAGWVIGAEGWVDDGGWGLIGPRMDDEEPEQNHGIQAIEVRPSDCVCGGWDILLRIESAVAGTTLAVSKSAQGIVTLMPCRYDGSPQSDWADCPSLWVESQLLDYIDAEGIDPQELEAVAADAIRSAKVDPS